MVFSEPIFLFLFLPMVLGVYFAVPVYFRNAVLLLASLIFYAWDERFYALIMVGSIIFNYLMGIIVHRLRGKVVAKWAISLCVIANLATLISFKYANFLTTNFDVILRVFGLKTIDLAPVHLPIGISFFTFQAMSYVFDVYRDDEKVQRNPINLALYISLFPQLIAGPIVRYGTVAAELNRRTVDYLKFASGVKRFVIGLSKKMIIANPSGFRADQIFGLPASDLNAPIAWLGVICYSVQIYFDFSGYSDMAIGLGRMFGFEFLENFEYPYVSKSITEFWRRWHISLSTWFRDYLYIPLGGSRKSRFITYRNLLIVFIICGFWHGASWNFLFWGLMHGLLLVFERLGVEKLLSRLPAFIRHIYVLLFVMFGWVFFRAATLPESFIFISALFGGTNYTQNAQPLGFFVDSEIVIALAIGMIGSTPILPSIKDRLMDMFPKKLEGAISIFSIGSLLLLCAVLMAGGTYNPFIYFRF